MPATSGVAEVPRSRTFWIVTALLFVSVTGPNMMPFQIGLFIDEARLAAAQAGSLGSAETTSFCVALVLVAVGILKLRVQTLALTGAVVAAIGHFVTATTSSYELLLGARAAVGFGNGMMNSAGLILVTTCFRDASRIVGYGYAFVNVCYVAMFLVTPWVIAHSSEGGLWFLLGGLALAATPLSRLLAADATSNSQQNAASAIRRLDWRAITLLVFSDILAMLGLGAGWSFSERIGIEIGVHVAALGMYFALVSLGSVGGSALAGWLSTQWGRALPAAGGIVFSAFSCLALSYASDAAGYFLGLLLMSISIGFIIPVLIGLAAALDSTGRVCAGVGAAKPFGFGLGAAAGGWVVESYSLQAVGWVGVISAAAALAPLLALCRGLDRTIDQGMRSTRIETR